MEVGPIRYRLYVSNASGIIWDIGWKDPNPFIEIFLNGNSIYTTTTKSRTLAPVWDECVELQSSDPTSLLSFKLCHRGTSGNVLTIGSRKVTVKDLVYLANRGGSLHLDNNHTKIEVVLMKKRPAEIKKAAHSPYPSPSPSPSPSPEPCPDSESPRQPPEPEEIPQVVEFREQDFSMNQAARIIRQTLARMA